MVYQNVEQYLSILKEWLPKDASIAIAMKGVYTHYLPGLHEIDLTQNQHVQPTDFVFEVMEAQKKIEKLIHNQDKNLSYYAIGYPLKIQNEEAIVMITLSPDRTITESEKLTFLTGKKNHTWTPVSIEDITHIESLQKKTLFYENENSYQTIYTLKELTTMLPSNFIRVHRSYIVNIKNIKELSRDISSTILITLIDNTTLPVSQSYTASVRKTLGF